MRKAVAILLSIVMTFLLVSCRSNNEKVFSDADYGKISIISVFGSDGEYVESGKKENLTGVVSIIVRNNTDRMLSYASITLDENRTLKAVFKVSSLPAGKSVLVMEENAKPYVEKDEYLYNSSLSSFAYSDASLENEQAKIRTSGHEISVENLTDYPVTAVVSYKYYRDKMFYGGIVFNEKIKNVAPGYTVKKSFANFDDRECKVVNVTVEKSF